MGSASVERHCICSGDDTINVAAVAAAVLVDWDLLGLCNDAINVAAAAAALSIGGRVGDDDGREGDFGKGVHMCLGACKVVSDFRSSWRGRTSESSRSFILCSTGVFGDAVQGRRYRKCVQGPE